MRKQVKIPNRVCYRYECKYYRAGTCFRWTTCARQLTAAEVEAVQRVIQEEDEHE